MHEVGEDLPLLLQQAPKSASQGIATILRALLDPDISGEWIVSPGCVIFCVNLEAIVLMDFIWNRTLRRIPR